LAFQQQSMNWCDVSTGPTTQLQTVTEWHTVAFVC